MITKWLQKKKMMRNNAPFHHYRFCRTRRERIYMYASLNNIMDDDDDGGGGGDGDIFPSL